MYPIAKIDGLTVYQDSYESSSPFVTLADASNASHDLLVSLNKWYARNQGALQTYDMYLMTHGHFDENFDYERILEMSVSDAIPEAARAAARQELEYRNNPWTWPTSERRPTNPKETNGYVYLMQCGKHYKIGLSHNPKGRRARLATQPPFDIELLHTIATTDMYTLESELHERFADKRKGGEWFELTDNDV